MEQKTKHNTLLNIIILFFIVVFGIGAVAFMAKLFNEITLANFLGSFVCISAVGLLFQAEYKSFRVLNGEDVKETKEIYLSGIARLIPYIVIITVTILNYQIVKLAPQLNKYNFDFFVGSLISSLVFLLLHLFIGASEKEYSFSTKRTTYIIVINNKFWFLSFKSWSKLIVAVGFSALTLGVLSSINSFYGNFTWPITFLYIYIAFFSYFREKREEYKHLNFKDIINLALEKFKTYWIAIRNTFVGEPTVSLYEVKRFLFLATVISLISSAIIDSSPRFSPETKEWIKSVDVGILTCYLIIMFLFQKSFKNSFQKDKSLKIILLIVAVVFILPLGTIGFSIVAVILGIYLYRKDKNKINK